MTADLFSTNSSNETANKSSNDQIESMNNISKLHPVNKIISSNFNETTNQVSERNDSKNNGMEHRLSRKNNRTSTNDNVVSKNDNHLSKVGECISRKGSRTSTNDNAVSKNDDLLSKGHRVVSRDKTHLSKDGNVLSTRINATFPNVNETFDGLEESNSQSISENQPKNYLKKFILNLKMTLKDEMVRLLLAYSSLLHDKVTSNKQNELSKQTTLLVQSLICLPVKIMGEMSLNQTDQMLERPAKKLKVETNEESNALELDWELRNRIVCNLMSNLNLFSSSAECMTNELKENLLKENLEMIDKLMNLSMETVDYENLAYDRPFKSENDSQVDEHYRSDDQSDSDLSIEAQLVVDKIDEEMLGLRNEMNSMKKEFFDQLREEVDEAKCELKRLITRSMPCKPETIFTFKLTNIQPTRYVNNLRYSEIFYCRTLPWSVGIEVTYCDRKKYCGLYLRSENTNDKSDWYCKTIFEFRILNQLNSKQDRVSSLEYEFSSNSVPIFGIRKFIAFETLINPQNGFYLNDSVNIQVYLRTSQIFRKDKLM